MTLPQCRARTLVVLGAVTVVFAACSGAKATAGTGACEPSTQFPTAIGCAYVFGKVSDSSGVPLDSIDGLIRLSDACACSSPRLESDENGTYATVVHRLPRARGFSDTATATVVALASAPKYPRHVTGAAYFDTSRVVLHFVPMGAVPPPTEVNLHIFIPER